MPPTRVPGRASGGRAVVLQGARFLDGSSGRDSPLSARYEGGIWTVARADSQSYIVASSFSARMAKFPSAEWLAEYVTKLNSNANYEDAARKWEGAMTFVVQKDGLFEKDAYLYMDLFHGKCRASQFSYTIGDLPPAQYKYIGPFTNWKRLINKEIDPIQGILTGKFKLEGSMMTIMRFTRAAKEMVATTTHVQTEF